MAQALPRKAFDVLLEALGDKHKAELLAEGIELTIRETSDAQKVILKDELRSELVTKDDLKQAIKNLEERFELRFKHLEDKFSLKFTILLIAIIAFGIINNPAIFSLLKAL